MGFIRALFFCLAAAVVLAGGEGPTDVLNLDGSNFDQHVGGSAPAFVEFFAPWCGHCKALAPEYEKLATSFKNQPVKIVAVDADKHRDLGSRFGIQGFPTLKYFPAGSSTPEDYNGGRTAKDIAKFINEKTGLNVKIKEAATAVTVLDDDNFNSVVLDGSKNVLVEFYAPWCGHCKKLAPDYEKVAKIFAAESDVVIANLDATENPASANKYGVSGYPTLKWFPKDNKDGVPYEGGRSVEDFVRFVNEKVGTERTADGGVLPTAGRIAELDELAARFLENAGDRQAILGEADAVIAKVASHKNAEFAKFYKLAMKRIVEKGAGTAAEEVARLERMLSSGNIAPEKKGEFQKRVNIAKVFAK